MGGTGPITIHLSALWQYIRKRVYQIIIIIITLGLFGPSRRLGPDRRQPKWREPDINSPDNAHINPPNAKWKFIHRRPQTTKHHQYPPAVHSSINNSQLELNVGTQLHRTVAAASRSGGSCGGWVHSKRLWSCGRWMAVGGWWWGFVVLLLLWLGFHKNTSAISIFPLGFIISQTGILRRAVIYYVGERGARERKKESHYHDCTSSSVSALGGYPS